MLESSDEDELLHFIKGFIGFYFAGGFVELRDAFKLGIIMAVINIALWGVIGAAWWKIIGLY